VTEWFLMAMIGGRLIFTGPMPEADCRWMKQHMMTGYSSVCVERRMLDGRRT